MNFEAPNELRYYKLNALTKELNSMARYETQVENIVRNMSARELNNSDLPELNSSDLPKLIAEVVQSSLDEERKHDAWTKWTKVAEIVHSFLDEEWKQNAWMKEDFTMQNIANCIYTQNADALLVFTRAAKHYADLYTNCSHVSQARLYVIKACNRLSELGYDRSQVTLGMIKTSAETFWRETLKRRANGAPVILPEIKWPDIFKSLDLDDLPPIPSGRPPENLPERDVPGFARKHPRRRSRGRSSKKFGGKIRPKLRKLDNVAAYTQFERQNVVRQNEARKRASQDPPTHEHEGNGCFEEERFIWMLSDYSMRKYATWVCARLSAPKY
jgi:hypothetical protein